MKGDEPLDVIVEKMYLIQKEGGSAFIKFTCDHCGSRQTSDVPGVIHLKGYTCEECGQISYPEKFGLMVIMGANLPRVEIIIDKEEKSKE